MAFNIKNPETDELVRELTALTGESLTTAVTESVRERLARERLRRPDTLDPLDVVLAEIRALPILNDLTEQEIMGWDEFGLPT